MEVTNYHRIWLRRTSIVLEGSNYAETKWFQQVLK
jgi:hypothetical protein